jgi:hypothetical protein
MYGLDDAAAASYYYIVFSASHLLPISFICRVVVGCRCDGFHFSLLFYSSAFWKLEAG